MDKLCSYWHLGFSIVETPERKFLVIGKPSRLYDSLSLAKHAVNSWLSPEQKGMRKNVRALTNT